LPGTTPSDAISDLDPGAGAAVFPIGDGDSVIDATGDADPGDADNGTINPDVPAVVSDDAQDDPPANASETQTPRKPQATKKSKTLARQTNLKALK
jgi:hypothetical protein